MADDIKYHKMDADGKGQELGSIGQPTGNFKNDLLSLFEPDNIKDGISPKILQQMQGIDRIMETLETNKDNGISTAEGAIQKRQSKYGKNIPVVTPPKSFMFYVCEQFEDLMLKVLTGAAVLAVIVGILKDGLAHGWMEGVAICAAVVIVVSVGSVNNWAKERQFAKLNSKKDDREVKVTRDGQEVYINIYELLVGDVYHVMVGEQLPVDGLLFFGSGLSIDESSMTGESDLIAKCAANDLGKHKKATPFILSGSKVMDGTGAMIVCSVGTDTQIGKLKLRLQEDKQATPLQLKLEDLANDIGKAGLGAAVLTVTAMCCHLAYDIFQGKVEPWSLYTANQLVKFLIVGVTIIVVAIPEGLPLAVTIALAYSVGKMREENNLVRHLASCEIMGGANNICSDKTGTLTQNQMTVTNLYMEERSLSGSDIKKDKYDQKSVELLAECCCVNSDANPKKEGQKFEQLGNKTECALLEMAYNLGYWYPDYRKSETKARIIPFNSARKRMVTVYKKDNLYRVYVKGASEVIVDCCDNFIGATEVKPLSYEKKQSINHDVIESFAKQSLRTLGLAYKEMQADDVEDIDQVPEEELENGLTLIGIAGIKDPLRPDVTQSIDKCRTAGINVRMCTGDNVLTAVAISKECGILPRNYDWDNRSPDDYQVLEGKVFRELVGGVYYEDDKNDQADEVELEGGVKRKGISKVTNFEKFKEIARNLKVLARSTPDDKYTLVTGLIQLECVVAVTGDGTNDAPALKKADVGFAMGIAGTEVAKEAAGIILLDDNFSSIVTACKWGRNIFDSIRKFLQFQLTINVVACALAFLGGVVIKESPLTSIQMLWVNLIMDSFASLALATEPPCDELLQRQPYSRKEYIVTPQMMRIIVGQAVYQLALLVVFMFMGPEIFKVPTSIGMDKFDPSKAEHFTIIFHSFVMLQVWNQITCRKLKKNEYNVFSGFFTNSMFLIIMILIIVIQVSIIQYGGAFFRVCPLTWEQHLYCVGIGFSGMIWGLLIKFIPDAVFNQVRLFSETTHTVQEHPELMDQGITSKFRRKASGRMGSTRSIGGAQKQLSRQASRK